MKPGRQSLVMHDAIWRRIEEQHILLLDASWALTMRHLQHFQVVLIEQPGRAAWLFRQTLLARETVTASSAVAIADDQELADEVQYLEDRHRRFMTALATVGGAKHKPEKVRASSHRLSLVPKRGAS